MIIERQDHPIERLMDNALTKIRTFVDANTIVGNPVVTTDGVSIIPISKVTMGFLTGGGEYGEKETEFPFAGGSGAGVSVSPIGFLVSDGKSVKLVNIDQKNVWEKLFDTIPDVISLFSPKKKD